MDTVLLQTKLYMPATRSDLVARPHLICCLHAGLGRKLTLVSASAGFGKTTLVAEWIQQLRDQMPPVAVTWLSLDDNDNDPARFLIYFVAALKRLNGIGADFGMDVLTMLESPQPQWESIWITLINEISQYPGRFVFVLDDYHHIENQTIHDLLTFLLQHLPPQMHLAIVTRVDPPLPIARLRVRGVVTELRARDLRFTAQEIAEFTNVMLGITLAQENIDALEQRTEGWVAGLQLAALSMQGQADVSAFIQSFSGSHRFVLDYLIEEVLSQQSEAIQTFLLQTSILNQMTGALCDALTGQRNGHETLTSLEHANLFVVPLDQERRWYRYHHLFADLLQQRLHMTRSDTIQTLHRKAAAWYEAAGYRNEAIHHALVGDDLSTAIRLMEAGAEEALERSDFNFIFNCMSQLPEHALPQAPWLYVYHCWALILIGRIVETEFRLANTDWLLESVADNQDQLRLMQGYIAGLQTQVYGWQRDFETMRTYTDQAIALMPEQHWVTAYCYMAKGVDFWAKGDLDAATDAFSNGFNIGIETGNARVAMTGSGYLVHSLELQGFLARSINLNREMIQRFTVNDRSLPVTVYLHVDLSRVLIERDELDLAAQHLSKGIDFCRLLGDTRVGKLAHYLMARVHIAHGEYDAAQTCITRGDALHTGTELAVDMRGADYPQVRLWLAQGKLYELESWLQSRDLNVRNISHFKTRLTFTMHARVMLALHNANPDSSYLEDARNLLHILHGEAQSNEWRGRVIEILALQALAYDAQDLRSHALDTLKLALDMAVPEGYIRTFVDEGPAMARLLYEALSRDIQPTYIQRLLNAFPKHPAPGPEPQITATDALMEPLSDREIDVLKLIAEGLTNSEISRKLYVSLNTVKVHTRNIYGKLGVNNRTQAANRAKVLGLII